MFIKKKCTLSCCNHRIAVSHDGSLIVAFYKEKQMKLTGSEKDYARAARISPAEGNFERESFESHAYDLFHIFRNWHL